MTRAVVLRRALWATALFNAGGAPLFFFPASFSQLVQMPLPGPILYAWFSGAIVAIFAGVYAWLALQDTPSRPFLVVGAMGKIAFFAVCVVSWVSSESVARVVAIASLDLVFAAIFLYCLPKKGAA
jgi:hypothetical protein